MGIKPGLGRSVELFRAFRTERSDPDAFYRLLARDAVNQVARHQGLQGKLVVDVGGGVGYFTDAFREVGASCVLVEPELRELVVSQNEKMSIVGTGSPVRNVPTGAIVGDGFRLPFADASADVSFSSNVLEHVADPPSFIAELVRITKPGGCVYVSFTNWFSPWGGHATSPWHYFGGRWSLERHIRRTGHIPVNRYGESLFAVHIGPTLRWARESVEVDIIEASPRYYPSWCGWIVRIPGIREVVTWNLMLLLRRRPLVPTGRWED
jgi:SAM-dependent methyltransferase